MVTLHLVVATLGLGQAPVDIDRLRVDAVAGWERFEKATAKIECKCKTTAKTDGQLTETFLRHFKVGPIPKLTESAFERHRGRVNPRMPRRAVYGVNSRYAFELEQPRETKDGAWLLRRVVPAKDKEDYQKLAANAAGTYFRMDPINIGNGHSLAELIGGQTFKVVRLGEIPRNGGGSAVRLEFDNTHPVKGDFQGVPVQTGTVDLDPASNWVVLEFDVVWHGGESMRGTFDYAPAVDGLALPRRFRQTGEFTARGGKRSISLLETEYEYLPSAAPLREDEATLPAFGLPEPEELAITRWYLRWPVLALFLAGLLLILGASWLRRRSNRAAPD
jgi:hypothetical protein